jgi:glycosyltransferase involved in cell wall biosynthesis
MEKLPTYVVVTPARNEAKFIELTLKSVVSQIVRPLKWVIVSDGSTDGTDVIIETYAAANPWIELVKMPGREGRDFAGKVHAFNAGYARVSKIDYEVIVSLDADISFGEDYFSYLLTKLDEDPELGLAGTPFDEGSGHIYDYRYVSIEHVSGACQMFRRECFDAIGGYCPVKGGLIDRIAVISARMKGWKTRTFTERTCFHHRAMGTAQHGRVLAKFKDGAKDYAIGNHPAWELFRSVYQLTKKPFVIGGLALGVGYSWSAIRNVQRPVSGELVRFHRREQMHRLRKTFASRMSRKEDVKHTKDKIAEPR